MNAFQSINPFSQETIETYSLLSDSELEGRIHSARQVFATWRHSSFTQRAAVLEKLANLFEERAADLAELAAREMGKPVVQGKAEAEKCAWVCRHYAEHGERILSDRSIATDASNSFVRYAPLGVVLAIMPWNYPYWQVMRYAAPAVMAGNASLLKHAPNVQGCAQVLENLFREAESSVPLLQNLCIDTDQAANVIAHPDVAAVTLTGSTRAGSAVASQAGKYIKKTVLELGGSNAFIVLPDADPEEAAEIGYTARMQNNGQSCIAAKRFIVTEPVADAFTRAFVKRVEANPVADPMFNETFMGPVARVDLAENLERQLSESLVRGATILTGGMREAARFEPTVLTGVIPSMPAFDEETFGPLAAITIARDTEEAIALSNQSSYGLGCTICTSNPDQHLDLADQVEEGAVFFNQLVKSDPRLPFGGILQSGYGRELSDEGIREFTNVKTVFIR